MSQPRHTAKPGEIGQVAWRRHAICNHSLRQNHFKFRGAVNVAPNKFVLLGKSTRFTCLLSGLIQNQICNPLQR